MLIAFKSVTTFLAEALPFCNRFFTGKIQKLTINDQKKKNCTVTRRICISTTADQLILQAASTYTSLFQSSKGPM